MRNWKFYSLSLLWAVAFVWGIIDMASAGAAFALAAIGSPTMVTGARARANWESSREDTQFARGISLLQPNENPMTLITMDLSTKTSATVDYKWYEDELTPFHDQINYAGGDLDGSSTAIDVDNGDRFAVGDLVMHDLTREVMLVTAVTGDILTVTRDYGQAGEGWTALAGSPANNDYVSIVGNAFEQGHPLPSIRSTTEVLYTNYCQDLRTPLGMSEVAAAQRVRGENDLTFQQRKAGIVHQYKMEYQHIWGKPYAGDKGYYVSTTSNTAPTTAGGMNHYMGEYAPANQKQDQEELTEYEFQEMMESVFEYGSSTKYCYCPPNLRSALDAWGISKMNTFVGDSIYGMPVSRWTSSHGEVVFVNHKLLKRRQSTDYFYAFFVDQDELSVVFHQKIGSTRLRRMDPYKATGETGIKREFQTISCMHFGMPAKHLRLRYKSWTR